MDIIYAFLMMAFFITIAISFIKMIIQTIKKKNIKKSALNILLCYLGILVSVFLSDLNLSIFFAFLAFEFIISVPALLCMLVIKVITKQSKKETGWCILGCFLGFILSIIISMQLTCEHNFKITENVIPTCSTQGKLVQYCPECNYTKEEILPISHQWKDATCAAPKTCNICNLTEGTPINHLWQDVTCTSPKTCSYCGLTEGKSLTHSWQDATCTSPKTCSYCGLTEGTPINHTLSDWEIIIEATNNEQGTRQQKCLVCGIILNTEKFDSPLKKATDIVKKAILQHSATSELESILGDKTNNVIVTGTIFCKNSEESVQNIITTISEELKKSDITAECIFFIADINNSLNNEYLATATIDVKGNCKISSLSTNFKTKRNEWINSQFSAWDGSHTALKKFIKANLNDEDSFKHIETKYIDIETENKKNQVNGILKQSGYSQRVDIGDLFIITTFSAKNAFNATIKNTAYGIADYSDNLIKLVGIE